MKGDRSVGALIYEDMKGEENPSWPAKATGTFSNQRFCFVRVITCQSSANYKAVLSCLQSDTEVLQLLVPAINLYIGRWHCNHTGHLLYSPQMLLPLRSVLHVELLCSTSQHTKYSYSIPKASVKWVPTESYLLAPAVRRLFQKEIPNTVLFSFPHLFRQFLLHNYKVLMKKT